MSNTNRLGRGLGALIPGGAAAFEPPADAEIPVTEVDIDLVVANPQQPRMEMDPEALMRMWGPSMMKGFEELQKAFWSGMGAPGKRD